MTFANLQRTLGIKFHDSKLLSQAFVHRSYLNENRDLKFSNERLEFLGDSIISYLTSDYLYTTYPEYPEGILTNIRSSLVKTQSLSSIASKLKLGELLYLSKGEEESGGRNNLSLLADTFEALVGAIYLDQGLETVKKLLHKHLFVNTQSIVDSKSYIDFKSNLQELIQEKTKISPTYSVVKSEGPDHDKTFFIEVRENSKVLGLGKGKSKQEAEQNAARYALEKIKAI